MQERKKRDYKRLGTAVPLLARVDLLPLGCTGKPMVVEVVLLLARAPPSGVRFSNRAVTVGAVVVPDIREEANLVLRL